MKRPQATVRLDSNGHKVFTYHPVEGRAFSVQTNGNLPKIHYTMEVGNRLLAGTHVDLWKEFRAYIKEVGTDKQKSYFLF